MIQNSSVKKHGSDQSDVAGPTPRSQRTKIVKSSDDNERKVNIVTLNSTSLAQLTIDYSLELLIEIYC